MIDKNYPAIRMLVLEECLQNQNTVILSKKMGFKFDKCKRWFENEKILKWDEFLNLCVTLKLNVKGALEAINFDESCIKRNDNIFVHLNVLNSFDSKYDIAEYLHFHVSVIKRYIQGNTVPDLDTVFKMIDYRPNLLTSFLFKLFSGKIANSELAAWIENGIKDPFFKISKTIITIIEACLLLERYKTKTTQHGRMAKPDLGN